VNHSPEPRASSAPEHPSLALVIAAYNAQDTLAAALDSVLDQHYQNWQVLLVDDGSSDSTLSIAQQYAEKDPRIHVQSQPNAGAGAARNAALTLSVADYTAYLDADDRLSPEHMVVMLRLMRDLPGYDIYSSDGLFVAEDGSTTPVFDYGSEVSVELEDLLDECVILGGGALVRTDVLHALHGFREHLYGEDYDLWLRALAAGYTHVATPEPLYIYHRSVAGQKSEDPQAGRDSAAQALGDLIESGLLTRAQKAQARATIARYSMFVSEPALVAEAALLRSRVENVFGKRLAVPVMAAIHSVSWTVRPLRRALARRRRA
jgi:cellulose synthase/poly-beta-1,6-N-acetylglucosamine synthase-like glycosyltransferase